MGLILFGSGTGSAIMLNRKITYPPYRLHDFPKLKWILTYIGKKRSIPALFVWWNLVDSLAGWLSQRALSRHRRQYRRLSASHTFHSAYKQRWARTSSFEYTNAQILGTITLSQIRQAEKSQTETQVTNPQIRKFLRCANPQIFHPSTERMKNLFKNSGLFSALSARRPKIDKRFVQANYFLISIILS